MHAPIYSFSIAVRGTDVLRCAATFIPLCIWWVLLIMRVADCTFHDESYSSPAAKGLRWISVHIFQYTGGFWCTIMYSDEVQFWLVSLSSRPLCYRLNVLRDAHSIMPKHWKMWKVPLFMSLQKKKCPVLFTTIVKWIGNFTESTIPLDINYR